VIATPIQGTTQDGICVVMASTGEWDIYSPATEAQATIKGDGSQPIIYVRCYWAEGAADRAARVAIPHDRSGHPMQTAINFAVAFVRAWLPKGVAR
jgi:hypothetical protein